MTTSIRLRDVIRLWGFWGEKSILSRLVRSAFFVKIADMRNVSQEHPFAYSYKEFLLLIFMKRDKIILR